MKKILIVDDDPNIIDYLTTLFEDNGYSTFSAQIFPRLPMPPFSLPCSLSRRWIVNFMFFTPLTSAACIWEGV